MSIKVDLSSDICPSCGFKKDVPETPVCFYCYYRGTIGATKMYILMTLRHEGIKLNTNEVVLALNKCKINDGRKNFKYMATFEILNKLSGTDRMYNILSKSKVKNGKPGRPVVRYKYFATRADKYLNRYLANWYSGRPVGLPYKRKQGTWEKDHSLEIRNKARAIRTKIRSGEYDKFDFIFPEGLMNNPKFHVRKVDDCVRPDVLYQQPHSSLCQTSGLGTECCVTEDRREYVCEPK